MQSALATNAMPAPVWLALMILGFVLFWPLGLIVLAYIVWSGKMSCCFSRPGRERSAGPIRWTFLRGESRTTGNMAFDEYREATLQRLEEERVEFARFLERLRHARDKAEFDQFMAERAAGRSEG